MNWVLIIVLLRVGDGRIEITNMPGYQTKIECEVAAAAMNKIKRAEAWCVLGFSR